MILGYVMTRRFRGRARGEPWGTLKKLRQEGWEITQTDTCDAGLPYGCWLEHQFESLMQLPAGGRREQQVVQVLRTLAAALPSLRDCGHLGVNQQTENLSCASPCSLHNSFK